MMLTSRYEQAARIGAGDAESHRRRGRPTGGLALAAFGLLLLCGQAAAQSSSFQSVPPESETLDLSGFELTFVDEFHSADISAFEEATWYPATPWFGDFGEAVFVDHGPNGPFSIRNHRLVITATRTGAGQWQSGMIASVNPDGEGFTQQYGYFEARIQVPTGEGVWPAFWLIGINRLDESANVTAEIDIMEHYGVWPDRYSMKWHQWGVPSADGGDGHNWDYSRVYLDGRELADNWHTFGALVEERTITYYFNRREVWSAPTPNTHRQPMMLLVSFGLGGGWPVDPNLNNVEMLVDYVRVYRRR